MLTLKIASTEQKNGEAAGFEEKDDKKMDVIRTVRAVGGFFAIASILVMILAQFFVEELTLRPETTVLLLSLISALLGFDILREKLPIEIKLGNNGT